MSCREMERAEGFGHGWPTTSWLAQRWSDDKMKSGRKDAAGSASWNWERVYAIAETIHQHGKEFLSDGESAFLQAHPEIEQLGVIKFKGLSVNPRWEPSVNPPLQSPLTAQRAWAEARKSAALGPRIQVSKTAPKRNVLASRSDWATTTPLSPIPERACTAPAGGE